MLCAAMAWLQTQFFILAISSFCEADSFFKGRQCETIWITGVFVPESSGRTPCVLNMRGFEVLVVRMLHTAQRIVSIEFLALGNLDSATGRSRKLAEWYLSQR